MYRDALSSRMFRVRAFRYSSKQIAAPVMHLLIGSCRGFRPGLCGGRVWAVSTSLESLRRAAGPWELHLPLLTRFLLRNPTLRTTPATRPVLLSKTVSCTEARTTRTSRCSGKPIVNNESSRLAAESGCFTAHPQWSSPVRPRQARRQRRAQSCV